MSALDVLSTISLIVAAILVLIILSLDFRFNIFMFIVRKIRALKLQRRKQ